MLSLGATHVINRSSADVASEITKALNGTPVKFILDTISLKDTQTLAWDLLSSGGTLVLVLPPEVDADKYKDKTLFHIRAFLQLPSNRDLGISLFRSLTRLLEDGSIKVSRIFHDYVYLFLRFVLSFSQIVLKCCPEAWPLSRMDWSV